jgi:hypothetical protein
LEFLEAKKPDIKFIEIKNRLAIKQRLRLRAKGRKIKEINEVFQLREDIETYITDFKVKNRDIGWQNTYLAGVNDECTTF